MLCLCWSDWVSELGMHPSLVLGRGWGGVAFPVPLPFPSSGCGPRTLLPSHERVSFSPVLAAVSFHRCPKEAALVALSPHFLYTHTPPPHTHTLGSYYSSERYFLKVIKGVRNRFYKLFCDLANIRKMWVL